MLHYKKDPFKSGLELVEDKRNWDTKVTERISQFCSTNEFRDKVKHVLTNELNERLKTLNSQIEKLESQNKSKNSETSSELRSLNTRLERVKSENTKTSELLVDAKINREVPRVVRECVDDLLTSRVAREIQRQLPEVLENHHRMQVLFDSHEAKLKESLTTVTKDIIYEIVSDPQYHTINQAYFDSFKNQGQIVLDSLQTMGDSEISSFREKGSSEVRRIQDRCDRSMKELSTQLAEMNGYISRTHNLERELERMKSWVGLGLIILGILAVSIGGIIGQMIHGI